MAVVRAFYFAIRIPLRSVIPTIFSYLQSLPNLSFWSQGSAPLRQPLIAVLLVWCLYALWSHSSGNSTHLG